MRRRRSRTCCWRWAAWGAWTAGFCTRSVAPHGAASREKKGTRKSHTREESEVILLATSSSTALLEGPSILILCTYPELSVHPGYQGGGHRWASRVPRVMLNATFATATDVQRLRGFTYHASPLLPKLSLADLLER